MKALLMHPGRDFDPKAPLPRHERDLTQDLGLAVVLEAMAGGDEFVGEVARRAVLTAPGSDHAAIVHRQQVLGDCLENAELIRSLYALAVDTLEQRRRSWLGVYSTYPPAILGAAVELMQMFVERLRRLRRVADEQAARFRSAGMRRLFAMLREELGDEYLARIERHLAELKFRRGVLVSAALGEGNQGVDYVLRPPPANPRWRERIFGRRRDAFTFHIAERDEAGARALGELRNRGINLVANALAQSTDHLLAFFEMLRAELAFYVGGLNLAERLRALDVPICFPAPAPAGSRALRFRELCDPGLALSLGRRPVGNSVDADGRQLVLITGANQGGKSSFLRAVGLAQLMLDAGLFVAAESFAGEPARGLYTHYKRQEDATMRKGKLDEELSRMSDIADALAPQAMVLFNESFAATNEREGSEIARQIVGALAEKRIRVFFVTHLVEFARDLAAPARPDVLALRAERAPDGTRSFRLVEGAPMATSYGEDVYREVFAEGPDPVRA
jgi:hypothetical protein